MQITSITSEATPIFNTFYAFRAPDRIFDEGFNRIVSDLGYSAGYRNGRMSELIT